MAWVAWGVPLVVVVGVVVAFVGLMAYLTVPKAVKVPIKGRHMLITGGSSGIGLCIAKLAAAEGARLSLVARDPDKLADAQKCVTEFCRQQGKGEGVAAKVNTYSADVKNFQSISNAIKAAVDDFGVIEVMVLSHGVFITRTFEDGRLEDFDHMVDTNLKGSVHTIKAALPHIKASKGAPAAISLFSSQAGQVGVYGYSVYAATKFGLRGLAECLQQELVDRNIRMSLVYPPDTDTPGLVEDLKTLPELTKKLSETSKAMDAMSVARASLAGLKAGHFHISCNLEGMGLNIVSAGMGPQPSLAMAVAEVLSMGLLRIVALFIQRGWYNTILLAKQKVSQVKNSKMAAQA